MASYNEWNALNASPEYILPDDPPDLKPDLEVLQRVKEEPQDRQDPQEPQDPLASYIPATADDVKPDFTIRVKVYDEVFDAAAASSSPAHDSAGPPLSSMRPSPAPPVSRPARRKRPLLPPPSCWPSDSGDDWSSGDDLSPPRRVRSEAQQRERRVRSSARRSAPRNKPPAKKTATEFVVTSYARQPHSAAAAARDLTAGDKAQQPQEEEEEVHRRSPSPPYDFHGFTQEDQYKAYEIPEGSSELLVDYEYYAWEPNINVQQCWRATSAPPSEASFSDSDGQPPPSMRPSPAPPVSRPARQKRPRAASPFSYYDDWSPARCVRPARQRTRRSWRRSTTKSKPPAKKTATETEVTSSEWLPHSAAAAAAAAAAVRDLSVVDKAQQLQQLQQPQEEEEEEVGQRPLAPPYDIIGFLEEDQRKTSAVPKGSFELLKPHAHFCAKGLNIKVQTSRKTPPAPSPGASFSAHPLEESAPSGVPRQQGADSLAPTARTVPPGHPLEESAPSGVPRQQGGGHGADSRTPRARTVTEGVTPGHPLEESAPSGVPRQQGGGHGADRRTPTARTATEGVTPAYPREENAASGRVRRCWRRNTAGGFTAAPAASDDTDGSSASSSAKVYISPHGRKNNCLFCMKKVTVLWRHQRTLHRGEARVREIVSLTSEEEKVKQISLLRFRGNFEHNKVILKRGYGELIVAKRPAGALYNASHFLPCPHCLIFVLRADLRFHMQKGCVLNNVATDNGQLPTKQAVYDSMILMEGAGLAENCEFEEQVLGRMSDDDIKTIIARDPLIKKFGSILYGELGNRGCNDISRRLRLVASVLQESKHQSMSDLLAPEHVDEAFRSAQVIDGLDKQKRTPHTELPKDEKPVNPMEIEGELRQLALLKKGIALDERQVEAANEADKFVSLVDLYWNSRVAHIERKTKEAKIQDKIDVLSLTEDLELYTQKRKMKLNCEVPENKSQFVDLSKTVLARLMVFNKRRPAEVSRVLLSSWKQRRDYKTKTIREIKGTMTELETQLFDNLDVVMAFGKRGHKVPVLIPDDAQAAIAALLEVRDKYVSVDNKYLLASPTSKCGHFAGCEALKSVTEDFVLSMPHYFTATRSHGSSASSSAKVFISALGRKNCCLFCKKKVAILWRHLKNAHGDETEVREICSLTSEEEKLKQIKLLKFRGNFEHNKIVLERGYGEVIVGRRPAAGERWNVSDFMPCPHCLMFVMRADLKRHMQTKCVLHDVATDTSTKKAVYDSMILMEGAGSAEYSDFEEQVLRRMNDDDIKTIITRDPLIKKFGSIMYDRLGNRGFSSISQRLRPIASVLRESNHQSMSDLLAPEHVDETIRCAQVIGGLDKQKKNPHTELPEDKKPGKAMKIVSELRRLAMLKKGIALDERQVEAAREADEFLSLVDLYWNSRVAHVALKTKDAKRQHEIDVLSLTEDLELYTQKRKRKLNCKVPENKSQFVDLSKTVLARLMVFNKRRPAEVSTVLLSSWKQRHDYKIETIREITGSMPKLETQLFNKLDVVMAIGKHGHKVPILIPDDAQAAIAALLEVRDKYVSVDNQYLLASPTSMCGHFAGYEALKSVIGEFELPMPHYFPATRLRKNCGTTSDVLALTDALTRRTGHDQNLLKESCRLPDTALELKNAVVLVECLDSGLVAKHTGQDLSASLHLAPDDERDEEERLEDDPVETDNSEESTDTDEVYQRRNYYRFTEQQTRVLEKLLDARGRVPKASGLPDWLSSQGDMFKGLSVGCVRAKLFNIRRMKMIQKRNR